MRTVTCAAGVLYIPLLRVPFTIYHKITLNIPFKLFFLSMTSLQLRCFSKSGHFASRLRSSRDSEFSFKIGAVSPKLGQLDTLYQEQVCRAILMKKVCLAI